MKSTVAGAMLRFGFVLFAAAGSLFAVMAGPAHADCTQSGTTVTCTGPSPLGFDAGAQDGLTVTVQPGATVGTGLSLNDNNITSNLGAISVGNGVSGIVTGVNNQITSSGIITGGVNATAIFANSGARVTNSGTLTVGDGGGGIVLAGTGSALNSGSIIAGASGAGLFSGADFSTLTNNGSIVVGPAGLGIASFANSLTVINNGSIAVGDCGTGITAGNGSTIMNAGTITNSGCGGTGILAGNFSTTTNSGAITVNDGGIGIYAGGGSTILNKGTITAGINGVGIGTLGNAVNSGTINVGGSFTFASGGMVAFGDNLQLTNTGTITGGTFTPAMIILGNNGMLANSGIIAVGDFGGGMIATGNNASLTNSGMITVGASGIGIDAQGSNSTVVNSGTIAAGDNGTGIQTADPTTVVNSGTITVGIGGAGIIGGDGTTVTNSGTVAVGANGIGITSGGNILNFGTVNVGDNGTGIAAQGNAAVANTGTIIVGANGAGISGSANIFNSGTINVGAGSTGIAFRGNVSVINAGMIAAGAFGTGISGIGGGSILSSGTITVGAGGLGIATLAGGNITNSGTITVGPSGIGIGALGGGNITNVGTIAAGGGGLGIAAVGAGNIMSSGTITVGTGGIGIVTLLSNASVTNSGAIGTCGTGIDTSRGGGSIINSGTIAGNGCSATGVNLGQGGTLLNSGVISASTTVALATGGNASVTNSGTLNGMVSLAGSGGNTLVNSGLITASAPLTPGGGVAHFVDGTFTQTGSGVFTTRLSPNNAAGNYDTLRVGSSVAGTGVANLSGTLTPIVQPGLYGTSTTYAGVLSFASSTGRFASISSTPSIFLSLSAIYNPTSVDLVITRSPFNQPTTGGANARAVGNVLEANYSTSLTGSLASFYMSLLQATAPNTLSQLTGEVATASQGASFTMLGQFLGTIFGQTGSTRALGGAAALGGAPQQAQRPTSTTGGGTRIALGDAAEPCLGDACDAPPAPPRYTAWAQGFGSSYSIDRNVSIGNSRVDMNAGGGATGIEGWLNPNALVGFTMGTASAGYSLTDLLSSGSARSIILGLYGGYTEGPAYVDAALAYGYATFTTNRFIGIGSLSELANGAFDGYQYGGRVEGGWRFGFDKNVLTPFAGLTVQALTQSAYTETSRNAATGAPGVLGLTVQGQTSTSIRSTLGAQFETAITASDDAVLRPRLRLGWAHEFNVYRTATATLGALLPNAPFTVQGAQPSPNALVVGAGFDLELTHMVRIYGQFDGEFSDNARAFAGTGGVRLVW
ncbi:MAG TPA: autotransporter domain-containing protein [Reyranella sp.]|nr:autotransporter domain-containing protein [Reyranella sp.]